jgi:RHS repeat-associated protein
VIAVSNSAGSVIALNSYDEYGIPQSTNQGRFQYTGQTWLPEVGLYYYKARMYSPTLGRFMQTDLLGYEYGMNWYAYVGGDPVNFSDPSGLCYYENWATFLYWTPTGGERITWGMVPGSEYVKAIGCDTTTQYVGNAPTQGGPSENSGGDASDLTITVVAKNPSRLPEEVLRAICPGLCPTKEPWPFPVSPAKYHWPTPAEIEKEKKDIKDQKCKSANNIMVAGTAAASAGAAASKIPGPVGVGGSVVGATGVAVQGAGAAKWFYYSCHK